MGAGNIKYTSKTNRDYWISVSDNGIFYTSIGDERFVTDLYSKLIAEIERYEHQAGLDKPPVISWEPYLEIDFCEDTSRFDSLQKVWYGWDERENVMRKCQSKTPNYFTSNKCLYMPKDNIGHYYSVGGSTRITLKWNELAADILSKAHKISQAFAIYSYMFSDAQYVENTIKGLGKSVLKVYEVLGKNFIEDNQ